MKIVPVLLLAALLSAPAAAQVKLPQPSPAASVSRAVGITDVRIDYHSPGVKKREIFGGLVPYNEVWRLGANDATTLRVTSPVKIGEHDLATGIYALFAIPGEKNWTIIVNKDWQQWGSYFYKPENDLFRFDVPAHRDELVEWMRFDIETADPNTLKVSFAWDRTRWSFDVTADVNRLVWAQLDSAMAVDGPEKWEACHQAARFSLDTGERSDQAMTWIDQAMALKQSFWNDELKARLLHRAGKTAEALPLLDSAMTLAEGKAPKEYIDGLVKTRAEWTAGAP
ncbi:MAG TPA: DUF2911 domain-containing protein [Candidatus Eisenbacteria bacterium]